MDLSEHRKSRNISFCDCTRLSKKETNFPRLLKTKLTFQDFPRPFQIPRIFHDFQDFQTSGHPINSLSTTELSLGRSSLWGAVKYLAVEALHSVVMFFAERVAETVANILNAGVAGSDADRSGRQSGC